MANLDTTSADLEVVLTDNGNDATTITFYYGTTDGGTTPGSWDSNVSFSNALEATIRKSVTGLTSGQTYYFRALAKNSSSQNNGEDWANSSTAFTTVTSSVREDTEAVRYSDLEGWWKLDGNLLDSSGNNRHGTPPIIQTSSLWLDAADTSDNSIELGSGNVQTWKDKSGNGHDASQSAGGSRPSPVSNGLNGLQVLSFDGTADHLVSTTFVLENAHSIYAVAKSDSNGWGRIVAGATNGYYFFGNGDGTNNFSTFYGSGSWNDSVDNTPASSVANASILGVVSDGTNATPYQNGSALNTKSSNMGGAAPAGLMVGKHATGNNSQYWNGHIAEIIFFNKNHSNTEREDVEGYLAQKWGLTGDLPSIHTHKSPSYFKSDSANGSGQSFDLSNGVSAIVQTGGTEDVFDGGSAFSTSLWVKGWPSAPGESLLTKDTFDVGTYGDLEAWLDSSSAHMMSTDASGTPPSNGDTVQKWYDLSGNQHHATVQENAPVWNTTGLNSKPTVAFTNDTMVLEDSGSFNWNQFSVALVWQTSITSGNYTSLFGRSISTNSWKDDAFALWGMKAWRPDLATKRWDFHINTDAGSYNHQPTTNLISSDNILILRVNNVKMYVYLNGTRITNVDISGNKVSRTFKLAIGGADGGAGSASMNVSEFILFSNPINAVPVEGYLAHKWGLEGLLPSGHAHKTSSPVTLGGWSTGRAASGTDDIALSMTGAGDEFSQSVPVNDNQWHHLATTYDGSNKKIYLDGVEVATAAQTGAVTASEFKLYLGDPISAGGSPTRPKIDDVRIYGTALTAAEVAAIYNEGENDVGAPKFSVTSPSTMQGAVGKSVSYQITTDAAYGMTGYNSAITYTLLNNPAGSV